MPVASSRVVVAPSIQVRRELRLFADAGDERVRVVDANRCRVRRTGVGERTDAVGEGRRAARPVAIDLGPDPRELADLQASETKRIEPMLWSCGSVYAWVRGGGVVALVGHGVSGSEFNLTTEIHGDLPNGVELAQTVAAVELRHRARLRGMSVSGGMVGSEARGSLDAVRLGRRALWGSTVGDAVQSVLGDMLRHGQLRLVVGGDGVPLFAFHELREWVVMEWARRVAGGVPLSAPAASVEALETGANVDLTVEWRDGDLIPLSVVRTVRYESLAADSRPLVIPWVDLARAPGAGTSRQAS